MLAGREAELAAVDERLDRLEGGHTPAQGLLFCGPRGNGKTTLLMETRRRAKGHGFRVVEFPVDALTARGTLVTELQERAGLWPERPGRFLPGSLRASVHRAAPNQNVNELLAAWIRSAPEPLVMLLDEAQALVPDVARSFFNAVQSAKSDSLCFLLVCAGTPDAPRQIRRAAAHNERGFEQVPVGRLARPDSLTAVMEPARQAGRPMDPVAADLLAEEGQDYPYFLQLLGDAVWRVAAAETSAIGIAEVRRGVDATRPQIEDFFEERFREADEGGVDAVLEPLAARFSEQGGSLRYAELRGLLDESIERESIPFDRIALLGTLRDLGVIWETAPRRWEMGIPSFGDHILRYAASR